MREDHFRQPILLPPGEVVVLVCGGRHYGEEWDHKKNYWRPNIVERNFLSMTLTDLHERRGFTLLIHGAASGADILGETWALKAGVASKAFLAEWTRLGKAAGFARNSRMLVEGKPQVIIAFKGGTGTKMMIDIARRASVEVLTPGWSY